MPPPPWAWQPTQFIHMNSLCPCAIWKALFSYSFERGSPEATMAIVSGLGWCVMPRCSRSQPASRINPARAIPLARKREDIEPSSRLGALGQIADGVDEAERGARIARVERPGDDRAGPAADAGDDCHILPAVGPAIGDRLADDS